MIAFIFKRLWLTIKNDFIFFQKKKVTILADKGVFYPGRVLSTVIFSIDF